MMKPLAGKPTLIDTSQHYCTNTICRARVEGVPTYYDDLHLGARMVRAQIWQSFVAPVREIANK